MLKKSSIPWTVKQVGTMAGNGRMNFDIAIQRKGKIWDVNRKSLLIHSLISGYPVPPFFTKVEGDIYYFIDGKQRMTTILSYMQDEFAISDSTPDIDDVSIAGLKYSELPEVFQKGFLTATLTITKFEDISDEQIEEMFYRLNNGVPLRAIESTRVLLGTENMKTVARLSEHPFFLEKVNISRNRYTDQEVVLHLLMLTLFEDTGLSSKEVRAYVRSIRGKTIETSLIQTVEDTLSFLNQAFDTKRKYLKKLHVPMIYEVIRGQDRNAIDARYIGLWADEFFETADKESPYWQASQSGSAKKENVQIRLREMRKSFNETFMAYQQTAGAES